jgi:hypothetical protein
MPVQVPAVLAADAEQLAMLSVLFSQCSDSDGASVAAAVPQLTQLTQGEATNLVKVCLLFVGSGLPQDELRAAPGHRHK